MAETYAIKRRIHMLRQKAAVTWNVGELDCHVGHLALQAMLDEPDVICQIDGATDQSETNRSVASRVTRLASAMGQYGLKTGDVVIVMGNNHLDLCIPFFACHVNGYSMCAIDPLGAGDLTNLWPVVKPKMIFCQKTCEEKVEEAFRVNGERCELILFDDEMVNLEAFTKKYNGTEINFRPAVFDQIKTTAWLILTSGTTGIPKAAVIPFKCLLNAAIYWWLPASEKIETTLIMGTIQWISGLLLYICGPLKLYTRLQCSVPVTPDRAINLINKYKPNTTSFTPYLLEQFLVKAENVCDLSCFKHIIIGGSAIEKPLLDRFRKVCNANINVVYGMSELLVPVFDFDEKTPFGASGKPFFTRYEYKLVDNDGHSLPAPNQSGELWIKGDDFFQGYRNNPEETSAILTEDGWFKTGDVFYKDEQDYYFFVERKRLLIKHYGTLISPLHMEEVLKNSSCVLEVCVVHVPLIECQELPVAAIVRRNGDKVDIKDLFDLLDKNIAVGRKLMAGFVFVDSMPITPSGKLHRAKVREMVIRMKPEVCHRQI